MALTRNSALLFSKLALVRSPRATQLAPSSGRTELMLRPGCLEIESRDEDLRPLTLHFDPLEPS